MCLLAVGEKGSSSKVWWEVTLHLYSLEVLLRYWKICILGDFLLFLQFKYCAIYSSTFICWYITGYVN